MQQEVEQLQEVSSLRTLNLANNKLEEFHLSSDEFGEVAANHLSWLSLKHNPFLKSLTLSGVAKSLEVLDVTHCRLQSLAALRGMRMLKSLACEHNELHSLHEVVEQLPARELLRSRLFKNSAAVVSGLCLSAELLE